MPNFQLRTTYLIGEPKRVGAVIDSEIVKAATEAEAISKARSFPVNRFIGHGDYAWLTDKNGVTIWSLRAEEDAHA